MSEPGLGLAARQAALVAALVAGAQPPAGFDPEVLAVTRRALLGKRAGEAAKAWPLLAAGLGAQWYPRFTSWADGCPPAGSVRDGWDLARELAAAGELPDLGAQELVERELHWRYTGHTAPRRHRPPRCVGSRMGAGSRDPGGSDRQPRSVTR